MAHICRLQVPKLDSVVVSDNDLFGTRNIWQSNFCCIQVPLNAAAAIPFFLRKMPHKSIEIVFLVRLPSLNVS